MKSKNISQSISEKLNNLGHLKFTLLVISLVLIKNGVHPIGKEWLDWLFDASKDFPHYTSYLTYSILPILMARIFGFPSPIIWWGLNSILILVIFSIFLSILNKKYGTNFKKVLIIFVTLPLFISPFLYIGHYDLLTIGAAIIASQVRNNIVIITCACIAATSNVEQALVTSFCTLILYLISKDSHIKHVFKIWFFVSVGCFTLLTLLVGDSSGDKRAETSLALISTALKSSLGVMNLIIFSVFGSAWFWIFIIFRKSNHKLLFILLITIPVGLCILTVDRTRVGVTVSALPILLLFSHIFEKTDLLKMNIKNFYYYFLAYLIIPQYFVTDFDAGGLLRLPYKEFFQLLFN